MENKMTESTIKLRDSKADKYVDKITESENWFDQNLATKNFKAGFSCAHDHMIEREEKLLGIIQGLMDELEFYDEEALLKFEEAMKGME